METVVLPDFNHESGNATSLLEISNGLGENAVSVAAEVLSLGLLLQIVVLLKKLIVLLRPK